MKEASIGGWARSVIAAIFVWSSSSLLGGTVVAWGGNHFGESTPCASSVVAIAAGHYHSLLLKADGTVAACGVFLEGLSPIVIPAGLTDIVAVSAGESHDLALKADGTVAVWGFNTYGQTKVPPGLTNVVAISAGATHNLALKADGTIVGWGTGAWANGLSNVVAISAGRGNSLVLQADGKVMGWGLAGASPNPATLSNIVAIAAGDNGSIGYISWMALQSDGRVVAGSQHGHLFGPYLSNVVAIAASSGTDHHISVAVLRNGTAVALPWGFNFYDFPNTQPSVPAGLANLVAAAAGFGHNLVLIGSGPPFLANRLLDRRGVMSGQVFFGVEATGAWPLNYQWRFNGTNLPSETRAVLTLTNLQPSQAGAYSVRVSNAQGVATSESAVLTLRPLDITLEPQSQTNFAGGTTVFSVTVQGIEPIHYQWQVDGVDLGQATSSTLVLTNLLLSQTGAYSVVISNAFGTVRSSEAMLTVVPVLITAHPQDQVMFIGGSASFSVAAQGIKPISFQWQSNDEVLAAETNSWLNLTNLHQDKMGRYSVSLSNAAGVVESRAAFLSLVRVAAWGSLGQTNVPADSTNVIAIAAGMFHQLALRADYTVRAWAGHPPPSGLTDVVAVASGCYASGSLALKEDGTIVMWGNNSYGWQPNLTVAGSLTNIVAAAGGQSHMLALKDDGTVVAWGDNTVGQTSLPSGLTNVVAIAAGQDHSLALQVDGTVKVWGYNNKGQTSVPMSLSNVVSIGAGAQHSLALRSDGTVVVWGGDGFYGQTNLPQNLTNVVAIAGGEFHSLALKADGSVVAWSYNFNGQTNIPSGLTNVAAVAAGGRNSMALIGDGPPLLHTLLTSPTWDSNGFSVSVPTQSGRVYRLEYKHSLSDSNWIGLPLVAGNGALRTLTDSTAPGTQRFYRVRRW